MSRPNNFIKQLLLILSLSLGICSISFASGLNLSLPQSSNINMPVKQPGQNHLPTLGDPSSLVLPPAEEQKMAEEFMQHVRKSMPLVRDPIVLDYINSLGMNLVAAANVPNKQFHFFVVRSSAINAFAGPGGYIGVNSGLLLKTHGESELAAVMGHEVAHVVENDLANQMKKAKQLKLPTIAAMLAGIALGASTGNAQLSQGAIGAVAASSISNQLKFSRGVEERADQVGIQILATAGYDPHAMPRFFERLAEASRYSGEPPAFASTHPLTEARIADTRNFADQYPKKKYHSSTYYYLARERARVDISRNNDQLINIYLTTFAKGHNNYYLHYGYALALIKANQLKQARQQIEPLIKAYPDEPLYPMALAKIDVAENNPKQAVTILKNELALYPDYFPLILDYAHALILAGESRKATRLLRQQLVSYGDNVDLYALLAKAEAKDGNIAAAYIARAKIMEMHGDYTGAARQLEIALKQDKTNELTRQAINAELKTVKQKEKDH